MSAVPKQGPDALAALLAYVAQVRDRQLDEIRQAAAAESKALIDAARAKARAQIRQALAEARRDVDARIALARAGAQARLRRARQELTSAALSGVRERVAQGVRARWADPAGRARWIAMALADAGRHLPAGAWSVFLPPGVPLPADATVPATATVEVRADATLEAGLRIACGDAQLDATLGALLRAPGRIASLWLGELERRRSVPAEGRAGTPA